MGDIILRCPLCCNEGFDSKKSLAEHLSSAANISCPICTVKFLSIEHLAQHLSGDNCETTILIDNVQFSDKQGIHENDTQNDVSNEEANDSVVASQNGDLEAEIPSDCIKLPSEANSGMNKMYVELLSKQLLKPCLETQELKLVMQDGESRYVVLSNNSIQNLSTENTVVPKQNNDGTLSLTTAKEPKLGPDIKGAPLEAPQAEPKENSTEIYSCNTCGVCFSSVIDHIQNYHNDQDVVVEEPLVGPNIDTAPELETHEPTDNNERSTSTLTLRRMITESGDIIEAPLDLNEVPKLADDLVEADTEVPTAKTEVTDKQGKGRRYVQIDKFCNSIIKNINEDEKGGPYHRVVLKELTTTTGSKIKIYNCISCNLYVPTIADFKSRPCKKLKYPCPHCPVAYENSKSLCAHMKVHKTKPELYAASVTFECTVCGTVFPTSKSLKLHKRMHDPIKSRPIDPPVETKQGTPVSYDKYLCGVCNKLIPVDYRTIHQNSHKSSNKMNCHICNKKFNSKAYLEMHMGVHNMDKMVVGKQDKTLPYNCVYCNRQFARPHEKVKHERIHTGEKPHSCEICGKSFRVSYCLTLHMRTHTGARPYACPHCGKRFKAHSVYNHHLLTHSEVRAYKCPFCPKAFKTSVQLAGHKNSHTKPFSCQQCNRPFASLYAVRVHMDSHAKQNSLKFSCTLCGASYARAFALKDHVRQTHQADMEAADALSGLKEEEWLTQGPEDDEESMESLNGDLNDEANYCELYITRLYSEAKPPRPAGAPEEGPRSGPKHVGISDKNFHIKTLEMNATDELVVP